MQEFSTGLLKTCLTTPLTLCHNVCMSKAHIAETIRRQAAALETQIESRAAELERMRDELKELRAAERVVLRLIPDDVAQVISEDRDRKEPTIGDRIVMLLEQSGPLRSADVLDGLQKGWRSDIRFETVSSTLSRVKAQGRIALDPTTKLWSASLRPPMDVKDEKGSAASLSEPSLPNGAAGSHPA